MKGKFIPNNADAPRRLLSHLMRYSRGHEIVVPSERKIIPLCVALAKEVKRHTSIDGATEAALFRYDKTRHYIRFPQITEGNIERFYRSIGYYPKSVHTQKS